MLFEKVESPGLAQYSYLIGDGYEAVVIDPRRDCYIYIELAQKVGMHITHIFETHRHEDFAVGSVILASLTGAQIWHADPQLPYKYGKSACHGQVWGIGSLELEARHTPGHTEGSRSYVLYTTGHLPWFVFTGDVLFTGEVGRVDFLGMDRAPEMAQYLYDSIFHVLLPLGDGVILCPGHGYGSACGSSIADRPWSTLGIERQRNPHLQYIDRETFIRNVSRQLPKPGYFTKMEMWNLQGSPPAKGLAGVQAYTPKVFCEKMKNAVVLDLRQIDAFAGSHIPGALSIAIDDLPSYVGWFVDPDESILLVCDHDKVNLAVTKLSRMGYDNVLGFLSGGMLDWDVLGLPVEKTRLMTAVEFSKCLEHPDDLILIDVRSPEEFDAGSLRGAQNIPVKGFNTRVRDIPKHKSIILYCAVGTRSIAAASALQRDGHRDVAMLSGGIQAWVESGLPLYVVQ